MIQNSKIGTTSFLIGFKRKKPIGEFTKESIWKGFFLVWKGFKNKL